MRIKLTLVLFAFTLTAIQAQPASGDEDVTRAIEAFFVAFHAKDTAALRSMLNPGVVIETVRPIQSGDFSVERTKAGEFLEGLTRIPDTLEFRETLHRIEVRRDGPLAQAWTPYSFHVAGDFSHCGVNSFQWLQTAEGWRLIYLVDTRRKTPCPETNNR